MHTCSKIISADISTGQFLLFIGIPHNTRHCTHHLPDSHRCWALCFTFQPEQPHIRNTYLSQQIRLEITKAGTSKQGRANIRGTRYSQVIVPLAYTNLA